MNGQMTKMELENKLLALQAEAQELDNKISAYEVGGSGGRSGSGSGYVYNGYSGQMDDELPYETVLDEIYAKTGVAGPNSNNSYSEFMSAAEEAGYSKDSARNYWFGRKSASMPFIK